MTDQQTDGPTDGQTDRPSYRDARTHLKKKFSPVQTSICKQITIARTGSGDGSRDNTSSGRDSGSGTGSALGSASVIGSGTGSGSRAGSGDGTPSDPPVSRTADRREPASSMLAPTSVQTISNPAVGARPGDGGEGTSSIWTNECAVSTAVTTTDSGIHSQIQSSDQVEPPNRSVWQPSDRSVTDDSEAEEGGTQSKSGSLQSGSQDRKRHLLPQFHYSPFKKRKKVRTKIVLSCASALCELCHHTLFKYSYVKFFSLFRVNFGITTREVLDSPSLSHCPMA